MRKYICAALLLAWVLPATPAIAGEEACDITCSPCLVKMVEYLKNKGWVGIEFDTDKKGVWVIKHVVPDSPAQRAGLKSGDALTELDGIPYTKDNMKSLEKIYRAMAPEKKITYTVMRGKSSVKIEITLGRVPEHLMAQWIGHSVLEAYGAMQKKS